MRNPWRYKIRCVFLSQGRIRRIIARTRDDGFSFVNTNNRRTRKKKSNQHHHHHFIVIDREKEREKRHAEFFFGSPSSSSNSIQSSKFSFFLPRQLFLFPFFLALSYSLLFSIKINASSIVNSVGSFSSGIVAFKDLYLM